MSQSNDTLTDCRRCALALPVLNHLCFILSAGAEAAHNAAGSRRHLIIHILVAWLIWRSQWKNKDLALWTAVGDSRIAEFGVRSFSHFTLNWLQLGSDRIVKVLRAAAGRAVVNRLRTRILRGVVSNDKSKGSVDHVYKKVKEVLLVKPCLINPLGVSYTRINDL